MYEPGTRIAFKDGDRELCGVVNGAPVTADGSEEVTHVPVHVYDGNRNVLVAINNIVTVLDCADGQG